MDRDQALTNTDTHLRSPYDYDEPEILRSSSHAFCPIGAEPGQSRPSIYAPKMLGFTISGEF